MKKIEIYENIEKLNQISTIKNELAFHLTWIYRVGQDPSSDLKHLIQLYDNCKNNSVGIDKLKFYTLREITINEFHSNYTFVEYNVLNIIHTFFEEILKYNKDLHEYT